MTVTNEPPIGFDKTTGLPDTLVGQEHKIFACADAAQAHCNFYQGHLFIKPDGRWGYWAKIKSFHGHKQWKGSFTLWDPTKPIVVWTSDAKVGDMNGGGLEQFWFEWPLGPDPGVANVYSYVGSGGCWVNVH